MIQIFPGKTAVYVSCPYSKELSCKKLEKSLEPFLRKTGDYYYYYYYYYILRLRLN